MSEHFGVDLGGSLLDRELFSEISDIDIAVEGLTGPEEFFAALGIAIEGTGLPVDVVELERSRPMSPNASSRGSSAS